MSYKLIYIIELNNSYKGGLYFATSDRIKSFILNNPDFEVEVFNLTSEIPAIVKLFKKILGRSDELQKEFILINGLECRNIRSHKKSIITYFREWFNKNYDNTLKVSPDRCEDKFRDCDLISAHYGTGPGEYALNVSELTGKPFVITYHGDDINITPFSSDEKQALIYKLLSKSSANIFVSHGLLEKSHEIYRNNSIKNHVIHNGIDFDFFKPKDKQEIRDFKRQLALEGKVVAFAGALIDMKNALILPDIFERIRSKYEKSISFLVIGNGTLKKKVEQRAKMLNVAIKFTGEISRDEMPVYYSSIDVLILPSRNEGMGMVLAEALACGAHCAGSRIGGIPEVIGNANCSDLDENFIENISDRVIYHLNDEEHISVCNPEFNLKINSVLEGNIYRDILQKQTIASF